MTTACECHFCRGGIEFESADFQEKLRTNLVILGQGVPCPHCGKTTTLSLDLKTEANPNPSAPGTPKTAAGS